MAFRYFGLFCALVLAVMTLTANSVAGSPTIESTPVPLPPKPDFSSLSFLVGTWQCTTKSSRRPAAFHTTTTYSMDPTGYWLTSKSKTRQTPWMRRDNSSEDEITYDPSSSLWVDISTGDLGYYDLSTSPGWKGNTMVWTDRAYSKGGGVASNDVTTQTKVSAVKTTTFSSFKETSGRTITVTGTCDKSPDGE